MATGEVAPMTYATRIPVPGSHFIQQLKYCQPLNQEIQDVLGGHVPLSVGEGEKRSFNIQYYTKKTKSMSERAKKIQQRTSSRGDNTKTRHTRGGSEIAAEGGCNRNQFRHTIRTHFTRVRDGSGDEPAASPVTRERDAPPQTKPAAAPVRRRSEGGLATIRSAAVAACR
jgi:hypothetical protein